MTENEKKNLLAQKNAWAMTNKVLDIILFVLSSCCALLSYDLIRSILLLLNLEFFVRSLCDEALKRHFYDSYMSQTRYLSKQ